MDKTDEMILDLMKGNARISYQELGDAIGMTRVAAKKRVEKLEREKIIRGYNTYISRDEDITLLIDIVTATGKFETVLKYVATRTTFIRQIYSTTKENHIHMVAVSDSIEDLKYLVKIIEKKCGDNIVSIESHPVKEIIKDVYGGITYEQRSESDNDRNNKSVGRRAVEREAWEQLQV